MKKDALRAETAGDSSRAAFLERLLKDLAGRRRDAVALHRALVSKPALNPEHGGKGEGEKARWLERRLARVSMLRQDRYDCPDSRVPGGVRPNIVAVMPSGVRPGSVPERGLWLVCHLDVAAPGPEERWESKPFSLRLAGDLMFGRGVEDNHQAIVSALLLFESFQRLGLGPPMRLGALFVSGALTDYAVGLGEVMKRAPGLFLNDDLFVVPDYGDEKGGLIELAEKVNVWIKVTVLGEEAHAGFSTGANAFKAAAGLIGALDRLSARFPARDRLFAIPHSTFTPTLSENSSTGANHIASSFVFYVDVRLLPSYSVDSVEKALRGLAEEVEKAERVKIVFERVEQTPQAPATSAEAPVARLLKRAINDELGLTPVTLGIGGVTMASTLRARALSAAVWSIQSAGKNKFNERYSIDAQISQTRVLARLLFSPPSARKGRPSTRDRHLSGLTPKELEVASLLGRGFSNDELMTALGVSKNTLRSHLRSLYRQTLAGSRKELAAMFADEGKNL